MISEKTFQKYPELLRWTHLEKIFGYSRRTIERRRAKGELRDVVFLDPFADGCLQATKESVIEHLKKRISQTEKDLTPPSLMAIGL